MQNSKMKKGLTVALVASMVVGSSLTVFAEDATSGELSGTGTSNGHLEKKAVKVVLPTVAAGADTFNYTVDPEGLISTGKDHAGNTVTANTDNVYFKNAAGDYSSSSDTLTVENQSSVAIDLTVKAEVDSKDTDIALANSADEVASAESALLYLGLKTGSDTEVVKTTGASKTVQIDGVESNFEVKSAAGGGYEYAVISNPGEWKKTTIGLTGKCNNKDIASDVTAPAVKVTWSWVDPSAAPAEAAPSITDSNTTYNVTEGSPVNVNVSLGAGTLAATQITSVEFVNGAGVRKPVASSDYEFANNVFTLTTTAVSSFISSVQDTREYILTFNDTASTAVTFTLTK